jgi:hypothetical protein
MRLRSALIAIAILVQSGLGAHVSRAQTSSVPPKVMVFGRPTKEYVFCIEFAHASGHKILGTYMYVGGGAEIFLFTGKFGQLYHNFSGKGFGGESGHWVQSHVKGTFDPGFSAVNLGKKLAGKYVRRPDQSCNAFVARVLR